MCNLQDSRAVDKGLGKALGAMNQSDRLATLENELQSIKSSYGMSTGPVGRLPPLMNPPLGPGGYGAPSPMMDPMGGLSMELVKTVNNQQGCIEKAAETMIKQQDMIFNLTQQLLGIHAAAKKAAAPSGGKHMKEAASLGVIRLDYDYPPSPGDVDCPESFGYDVYYRVVPGLTFGVCQSGKMPPEVEKEFIEAVRWMDGRGVTGITGDCGFMMYFQTLARSHTSLPVFMSSLAQLPAVTCGYAKDELIAVVTANSETLKPMRDLIRDECGVDTEGTRYIFVGAQDVPGFEAVALGEKVDVEKVTPGMVQLLKKTLKENPAIRAFLFECTELPPYSDAVRQAFGLPVYDSITCCNFFIAGAQDNERFGINNWQKKWDGQQADYIYGANLSHEDKMKLTNKSKA